MKSAWTGVLTIGVINIPIGLAPVTEAAAGEIDFRLLHRACSTPVKQVRRCGKCERDVASEEIVRGFEVAPGHYVLVEDEELDALAAGVTDRAVALVCFTDPEALPPLAAMKSYYLLPDKTPVARRSYRLFQQTLADLDKVALVRLSWRSEWVAAIRPLTGSHALVLDRLAFAEELRRPDEIDEQLNTVELDDRERHLARELVTRLWKPAGKIPAAAFENEHRDRERRLVEAKLAGEKIVAPEQPATQPVELPSTDLAEALTRSIRGIRAQPKPRSRARAGKR